MNTVIKNLSSGYEVEVRPVPPTAYFDLEIEFNRTHPAPAKPKISVKSVAGHVEEIAASMDSPEWAEYERAVDLRQRELRTEQTNWAYNYAVVRWQTGDENWFTEPPNTWQPDPTIPDKTSTRRVLFIKYELIATLADFNAINSPLETAPIMAEEVDAATAGFRPDAKRRPTRGRAAKR